MSESGGSGRASTRLRGAPNRDQYDKVKTKYKVFDKRAETEYARVEALHATKPFTATGNPYEYAVLYHLSQLKGEDRRRIKCIYSLHFFAFRRTGALISRSLSCVMFFPAAQDQPSPKGSPKPGKHGKGIYTISYMHFSDCFCFSKCVFASGDSLSLIFSVSQEAKTTATRTLSLPWMRLAVPIRLPQMPTTSIMPTVKKKKTQLSMLCRTSHRHLGPDRPRLPNALADRHPKRLQMEVLLITLPHWLQKENRCPASKARMSS